MNRERSKGPTPQHKTYRFYDMIMVAFVTFLLCSQVGATKVCRLWGFTFGGALVFFPITYLFGDILTEVYGYKKSRRVIWFGFAAAIYASFVSWVVLSTPADPSWPHQAEFELVYGQSPRIVAASLFAYSFGEFTNSYIVAKLKLATRGKKLWVRFVVSTILGQAVDTLIFYPLAFFKTWSTPILIEAMATSYFFKVAWEVAMIPFTYKIVNFLKRLENEDYYDRDTNFSPFSFR